MKKAVLKKPAISGKGGKSALTPKGNRILEFYDQKELNAKFSLGSNKKVWVEYNFRFPIKEERDQRSYEDFICGYLYYYDHVVRNGGEPHDVYFKWDPSGNTVRIYLDPEPRQTASVFPMIQKSIKGFNPQEQFYTNSKDKNNRLSPGSFSTDPQQPPPPPPPYA